MQGKGSCFAYGGPDRVQCSSSPHSGPVSFGTGLAYFLRSNLKVFGPPGFTSQVSSVLVL